MNINLIYENVKNIKPLIHHITNYVTVNDCANATLAIGGSPVMSDSIDEVSQMVKISSSLVLNIGTLNRNKINSMIEAGKQANEYDIPVIFDPVGCGATNFRNEMSELILKNVKIAAVRGNLSEILALGGENIVTKGVDSSEALFEDVNEKLKNIAKKLNTVLAITGKVDRITDGDKLIEIYNGCKEMSYVTGTGCMCSSLVGTLIAANKNNVLDAAIVAVLIMGISGQKAYKKYKDFGLGHFHMGIIDEIGKITPKIIIEEGKWYEK